MTQQPTTTLEILMDELWGKITSAIQTNADVPISALQAVISGSRRVMSDHGWNLDRQNSFFRQFVGMLKMQTLGHPVTGAVIRLLEEETRFDA